jgi:hypothetical protein
MTDGRQVVARVVARQADKYFITNENLKANDYTAQKM